ncbi:MAG: NUDIX domain-containing protein [Aggregatilineales bacterium]
MKKMAARSGPLRLGVLCAVFNKERLLLSRHRDLDLWTLPGGWLEFGETPDAAAARNTLEETGISAAIVGPIGLYYFPSWNRLSLLYGARAYRANSKARSLQRLSCFFPIDQLPTTLMGQIVQDAIAWRGGKRPAPTIMHAGQTELPRLRWRLNRGDPLRHLFDQPEPHSPTFRIWAAAVVWNTATHRVLTLRRDVGIADLRTLPRLACRGTNAPWEALGELLDERCGIPVTLGWAGVWQDASRGRFELVFGATIASGDLFRAGEWSSPRNALLSDHDRLLTSRVKPSFMDAPVWTLDHEDRALRPGSTITAPNRRK